MESVGERLDEVAQHRAFLMALNNLNDPSALKFKAVSKILINASIIINYKLHRNVPTNMNIEAESKLTKRNSQYKSMASNIVWYIAYMATTGREPPLICASEPSDQDEHLITSGKRRREAILSFIDDDGNERQNGTIKSENLITSELMVDNRKKDSYTLSLFQKGVGAEMDYSPAMVAFIIKNMKPLIEFALDQYNFYSRKTFEIEDAKKKKIDDSQWNSKKHKQLNVISKLYMAILFELDMEMVLFNIDRAHTQKEFNAMSIKKLLEYFIHRISNLYFPIVTRSIRKIELIEILKSNQMKEVCRLLMEEVTSIKYNNFTISNSSISCINYNWNPKDIKMYYSLKRNTSTHYCYECFSQLEFKTVDIDIDDRGNRISIIIFTLDRKEYLFDCTYYSGDIDSKTMASRTWKERLEKCRTFPQIIKKQYQDITLTELDPIVIQFDTFSPGLSAKKYYYIKTTGLGLGTFFIKVIGPTGSQTTSRDSRHSARAEDLNSNDDYVTCCSSFNNSHAMIVDENNERRQPTTTPTHYAVNGTDGTTNSLYAYTTDPSFFIDKF